MSKKLAAIRLAFLISGGLTIYILNFMSNSFDIITRGLRIGAFSGLAITIFALATDSKWLIEDKYFFKPREKGKQRNLYYQSISKAL